MFFLRSKLVEILSGLMDHQVLQRNKKNLSETIITGRCSCAGELQIRVTKNKKTLPGSNWKPLVQIKAGDFTAKVTGIPVGGPYRISLRLVGTDGKAVGQFQADDVLVGDVWILGGQSNMEGIGLLKDAAKPHPLVRAFYMDDRWEPAQDPIHKLCDAVDPVHTDLNGGTRIIREKVVGTGPGVAFGQKLLQLSGVPQGLISCGHGGTSMAQWDPDLKNLSGKSLYGATLRRFHKNGGKVAGVVWYQGCSDANDDAHKLYTDRMKKLVSSFRSDFSDSKLPFVMVQIAGYFPGQVECETNRMWISIQDQQRRLPEVIDRLLTVPAIDLALDDGIHISGVDQQRLGRRLAQAAWTLMKGKKAQKPPITLKSIKAVTNRRNGCINIEATFGNVEGSLRASGKPTGFSLLNAEHQELHSIYRIDLKDNKAILQTGLGPDYDLASISECYGYGVYAYCNITDQADRSLPVFAPESITHDQRPQRSVRTVRISKILPPAGKLEQVVCPDTSNPTLEWTSRTFPSSFCDLHLELGKYTDNAMVFFASKLRCEELMHLQVGLGYDGPIKLWIDKNEIFYDPNGTNPAWIDKTKVPVTVQAGEHEIVVALSANFGKAWGIFLRLYRTDLTKDQIKEGPDHYKLPEILG